MTKLRRATGIGCLAIGLGLSPVGATAVAADPGTPAVAGSQVGHTASTSLPPSAPGTADEWTTVADLPVGVQDTAAAWVDGRSYVLGGYSAEILHATDAGHVFDTATGEWSPIANLPAAVMQARAAVVDGVIYVFGGWSDTDTLDTVFAYDPETDVWSQKAPIPQARAASGIAVSDGKVRLIGGCSSTDPSVCTPDATSFEYDPAEDSWTPLPDFPVAFAHGACGTAADTTVCTGGLTDDTGTVSQATHAWEGDGWQQRADLPETLWGMASTAANGQLITSNGMNAANFPSTRTLAYDPSTDEWTNLPDSDYASFRGSMTCGLVKAGGRYDMTIAKVETLPGYTECSA